MSCTCTLNCCGHPYREPGWSDRDDESRCRACGRQTDNSLPSIKRVIAQDCPEHGEGTPKPVRAMSIGIQYKGTATCLDLSCPSCDGFTHYCVEMPFSGVVACCVCEAVWQLSPSIEIAEAQPYDVARAVHGDGLLF